jgi:RNA polymerase sigma factor (sigma-70 family)
MEDWKQLAEYVKSGSESAFESVVNEHLQMVYATALRKTGNRDAAEEVTQSTFIVLTEKAKTLTPSGSLGAWLHRTALLKSKERIKKDILQAERLQKLKEHGMPNQDSQNAWKTILPLLDDAVDTLREDDRQLLLLRFFQKRSLREVGVTLGIGEDAARKRVRRTVEKLRQWFDRRGITISSASLTICLEQTSAQVIPATLAASVLSAVHSASTLSATTSTLASLISIMKLKTASLIGLGIVVSCGTLFFMQQRIKNDTIAPNSFSNREESSSKRQMGETVKPGILEQVEQLNASTQNPEESQSLRDQFQALLTAEETARFADDPAETFLQGIPVAQRGQFWEMMMEALNDPELHVRIRAMGLLPLMWPQHKEALPWIEEKLRDGTIQPGKWMDKTFYALSQILTEPQEYASIVGALMETSEETKHNAGFQAPIMMAKFKDRPDEIRSLLNPYLKDENPSNRMLAAQILAQTEGSAPTEAIEILAGSLQPDRDIEDENQRLTLMILWKLGAKADTAVPALMQLADANPDWGEMVDVLLKAIKPEELQGHAMRTPLPSMTPEAQALIAELESNPNTLQTIIQRIESNQFTQSDVLALASLETEAKAAVISLTSRLNALIESNPQQAMEVGAALERMQPNLPKPLLTALDLVPVIREINTQTVNNPNNPEVMDAFREWSRNLIQSSQGLIRREDMAAQASQLKDIHPDLYQQWIKGLIKQDTNWNEYLEKQSR